MLTQVRDLISWMHDTSAVISTVEPARSVSGAEALLAKHSEYKAEIDAREESVTMVTKAGKKLIQQGHYANTEVCTSMRLYMTKSNLKYPKAISP